MIWEYVYKDIGFYLQGQRICREIQHTVILPMESHAKHIKVDKIAKLEIHWAPISAYINIIKNNSFTHPIYKLLHNAFHMII